MPPVMPPFATPRPSTAVARRRRPSARSAAVVVVCLAVVAAIGCGKKGPPLPPRLRVPAKISDWSASRVDEAVYLTLTVPSANVGGDQPGDVATIEIYGITAQQPPTLEPGRIPAGATLVATAPVRRPVPPPPPARDGAPPTPPLPLAPGLDQGAKVTFLEPLTPAAMREVTPAPPAVMPVPDVVDPATVLALPPVYVATTTTARRHYVSVAVSRGGRRGAWSDWKSVPLASPSGAPGAPGIAFNDQGLALGWTPAPDAVTPPPPPADGALDSRPFGPARASTRYNVYDAAAVTPPAPGLVTRPAPLNPAPLAAPAFAVAGVTFDAERCFVVRAIDTLAGVDVEGPASAPGCVTPRDTFPPPAPTALEAVAGSGVISLIWEAVEAPDLGGYLIFRGTAPGAPTTQLTPAPIAATSFEDRTVTAGTRYVYEVVAVDSATPVNRSAPSNRATEMARQ